MNILLVIYRQIRHLAARHRARQQIRAIEAMPDWQRKDIGWPNLGDHSH